MGLVYLYTGEGAGKTTNALGLALRAIGHDQKAIIIQFLKGRKDIGEYKIQEKLAPNYEIHQFGTEEFIDPKNLKSEDYELAKKGLKFAKKALKRKPELLILDELNYCVAWNLIKIEEVLKMLEEIPKETTVVITGRYAPQELIDRAEVVNKIVEVKFPEKVPTKKGIQY